MKKLFTILVTVVLTLNCNAQEVELDVKSKIKQVTVFLEGAQIKRHAIVPLKPGVSVLTFSGIAPGIQEQSIQVDAPSSLKILSVSLKVNYLRQIAVPEKIKALDEERRKLSAAVAREKSLEEVYREEEAILKTNKSIGGSEKGVPIAELKVAMDYFRQRLLDIRQLLLETDRSIRTYNESIAKIDAQLKELNSTPQKPTGEIVIKIYAKNQISAPLNINYLVKEARWFPSYDIRAKDIQSPVSITYKANVAQQSGEDWEDVTLTISSGNPSQGGARPIIKPWILGFNNAVVSAHSPTISTVAPEKIYGAANSLVRGRIVDEQGDGMPGVNVIIKGTTIGTVSDAVGYYSIPLSADAQTLVFSFIGYRAAEMPIEARSEIDVQLFADVQELQETVVLGYSTSALAGRIPGVTTSNRPRIKKTIVATPVMRQTNVEYTLENSFSVKSDGEVRTTDMVEYELDALFEYYCVPKLDTDAFLIAKVLQWDEYNFLEGEANLFFEDKYVGKSILDTRNTSDTLTFSLGRDGNVMVTREKKKDYTSRHVIGSNQKAMIAYDISVRNKKSQNLTIVIEDQIPVANDKEISVDKIEDSEAEYNKDTGILKWKKQIDPGKTEIINLKYAVRYPKFSRMILE